MKGRGISICGAFLIASLLMGCNAEGMAINSETTETESEIVETGGASAKESAREYYIKIKYQNFEESIIRASHIAEAKCVDSYAEGRYTYAIFDLKETLKGEFTDVRIVLKSDWLGTKYLCGVYGGIEFRENYTRYEVGKEYMLVLEGGSAAYHGFTFFHSVNNIFFPIENAKEASMYGIAKRSMYMHNAWEIGVFGDYEKMRAYVCDVIETKR